MRKRSRWPKIFPGDSTLVAVCRSCWTARATDGFGRMAELTRRMAVAVRASTESFRAFMEAYDGTSTRR